MASISALLLTNATLPARRLSWMNDLFAHATRFRFMDAEHGVAIHKKNQFAVGQPDFDRMSFGLIVIPAALLFFTYIHITLRHAHNLDTLPDGVTVHQRSVEYVSYTAAWVGTVGLSFFLIPVSRHSVLLVAMNWSPVHALRIHIWAGYLAFFFIFLHSVMIVGVWFKWAPGSIYEELIPPKDCWSGENSEESRCTWKYSNITGVVAMLFYTIIWATSFNWLRRKNYRLFYIIHVTTGSLTMLASIWHIQYIGLFLLPSLLYYLASTMPTLVQALASRFRGGVRVAQVVVLDDAGDCIEVHVSIDPAAEANLTNSHPSKFIKLCVPGISAVWHPLTVYYHPNDPSTMRMLIRPIGPFTKKLRSSLVADDKCPVVLIDGFYRGDDHCQQAMVMHDHVSIIAGGVALTPFLSMIFSILNEQLRVRSLTSVGCVGTKEQLMLRSMTLIWSCREFGLLSYIKEIYLDDIVQFARAIEDFEFNIKIYFTGLKSVVGAFDAAGGSTGTSPRVMCMEAMSFQLNEGTASGFRTEKKANHTTISYTIGTSGVSNGVGHAMEIGRMMPARFSRMVWNVPYFAVFTISIWLGFSFTFHPNPHESTFRELSQQAWNSILLTAFFLGVGIIVEASVLLFRNQLPAHCAGDSTVAMSSQGSLKKVESEPSSIENMATASDMYQYNFGRPSPIDMLADASLSTSPGLFVCGPKALVQTLYAAARQENSQLGAFRRYAIYEESFEM